MNGIVLWSDAKDSKALIWCEDHGELAYYFQPEGDTGPALDAGDWVQFELTMERNLRLARNPRMMEEGAFTDLADRLTASASEYAQQPDRKEPATAEIIPLHARRKMACRAG